MTAFEELAPSTLEKWLISRVEAHPPGAPWRVANLLPSGYPAYLRVFHPFVPWDQFAEHRRSTTARFSLRSWKELAEEAGVPFTAELNTGALGAATGHDRGTPTWAVCEGDLDLVTRRALLAALTHANDEPVYFVYGLGGAIATGHQLVFRAAASAATDVILAVDASTTDYLALPLSMAGSAFVARTSAEAATYLGRAPTDAAEPLRR